MSGRRRWFLALSLLLALMAWSGSARAAVGLISFDVAEVEQGIHVTWETGSEVNNLGFNLYRSVTPGSQGALLDFFPAAGGVGGAQYEYLDADVLPDTTYYYTLEALDVNGTGQYFGPLEITYQPAANATATPTFTFTPAPTSTSTATPTPTATSAPTITPLPTFTPAWTPTRTPTLAPGATYPPTSTPTPTATPTPPPTLTETAMPLSGQTALPNDAIATTPTLLSAAPTVITFSAPPTAAPLAPTPLAPTSSSSTVAVPAAAESGAPLAPPPVAVARNQPARPLAPTATPFPLLVTTRSSDAMLYVAGGFFFGALLLGAASLGIWRAFR